MTDSDGYDPETIKVRAVTIRQLESVTPFDRNRIAKELREAGLKSTPGPKKSKCYDLKQALETLFLRDDELSPSDQRNLAQAEKARTETAILKRKYIKIEEATECLEIAGQRIREIIDNLDVSRESKSAMIDALRTSVIDHDFKQ